MIACTPSPPYYAVIFTNIKKDVIPGYEDMADRMVELASKQTGFLGYESASDDLAVTISYWDSLEAIKNWKSHPEHILAQEKGRKEFYAAYKTRICVVERDYGVEGL